MPLSYYTLPQILDDIDSILPLLAELCDGYKPSWDPQEVIETEDEKLQRLEWAVMQTAREVLEGARKYLSVPIERW
jgi:hypothetical protein